MQNRNPYDHNSGINAINHRFWKRQSVARDGAGSAQLDGRIAFQRGGIDALNQAFWHGTIDSTHPEAELSTPIDELDNEYGPEDDEEEAIAASGGKAKSRSRDSATVSCRCKMRDGERFAIPE